MCRTYVIVICRIIHPIYNPNFTLYYISQLKLIWRIWLMLLWLLLAHGVKNAISYALRAHDGKNGQTREYERPTTSLDSGQTRQIILLM